MTDTAYPNRNFADPTKLWILVWGHYRAKPTAISRSHWEEMEAGNLELIAKYENKRLKESLGGSITPKWQVSTGPTEVRVWVHFWSLQKEPTLPMPAPQGHWLSTFEFYIHKGLCVHCLKAWPLGMCHGHEGHQSPITLTFFSFLRAPGSPYRLWNFSLLTF